MQAILIARCYICSLISAEVISQELNSNQAARESSSFFTELRVKEQEIKTKGG